MTDRLIHRLAVEKRSNQSFVAVCSCGWEGYGRKGTPFWKKPGALSACLGHQRDVGLEPQILGIEYRDLDPRSRGKPRPT